MPLLLWLWLLLAAGGPARLAGALLSKLPWQGRSRVSRLPVDGGVVLKLHALVVQAAVELEEAHGSEVGLRYDPLGIYEDVAILVDDAEAAGLLDVAEEVLVLIGV